MTVLFTVVHVYHGDYVRAMERRTLRRWSTIRDRPIRLDDRDDVAREIVRLMGELAACRGARPRRSSGRQERKLRVEMQIAQILMVLTAAGMGLRSFSRYGRLPRAAGAALVGFLLWPLMAIVLFFVSVSAAMGSAAPQRSRLGRNPLKIA